MKNHQTKCDKLKQKREKNSQIKNKPVPKNGKKKVKEISLKTFETKNRFTVFEDNAEDQVDEILKRMEINKINKCLLKKCRTCNLQKRSCLVSRSNCTAFQKRCLACNKSGHYPKSLNCKKKRKLKQCRIPTDKIKKPKN